jgi:hypothetical protein
MAVHALRLHIISQTVKKCNTPGAQKNSARNASAGKGRNTLI